MVSDFMTALELDCRERSDVRLVYSHELPKPRGRENRRASFRWTVDLPGKRRVSVIPDKVFALELTKTDGRVERAHYFLEADRGTMPIERRDFRQSCVMKKLKAYEATYSFRKQEHTHFPNSFCVVVCTKHFNRAKNISEVASRNSRGRWGLLAIDSNTKPSGSMLIKHRPHNRLNCRRGSKSANKIPSFLTKEK